MSIIDDISSQNVREQLKQSFPIRSDQQLTERESDLIKSIQNAPANPIDPMLRQRQEERVRRFGLERKGGIGIRTPVPDPDMPGSFLKFPSRIFNPSDPPKAVGGPAIPRPPLTPEQKRIVERNQKKRQQLLKSRLEPVRNKQGEISESKFKFTDHTGKTKIIGAKKAGTLIKQGSGNLRLAGDRKKGFNTPRKSDFKGFIIAGTDDGGTIFIKREKLGKFGTLKRDPNAVKGQRPKSQINIDDFAIGSPITRSRQRNDPFKIKPVRGLKMDFGNFFPSQRPDRALSSVSLRRRSKKKKTKRKQKPIKSIFDLSF